jgi:polysaccharide biosynthesis transport protein
MNETTDATAVLAPIWKRKWLILAVGILVAAASYGYYKRQPHVYSVTTQLYLGGGSEEQGLLGEKESKKAPSSDVGNQAALINSGALGEAVHQQLRKQRNRALGRAAASGVARAKVTEKSEFITITAEAHAPRPAALLANTVAQAYIKRARASYVQGVRAAIAISAHQIKRIEAAQRAAQRAAAANAEKVKGGGKAATSSATETLQLVNLSTRINQLESDLAVVGVQQVSPAKPTKAQLLSPHPKKNAIFGFVIGIVLAAAAAFALGRFDRRVRSLTSIETLFQSQILTALPAVKAPIVHGDGRPRSAESHREPLRRLHTSLQMGDARGHDHDVSPRVILLVSPDAGDGRSTVVANLALVQAEAGERVAVIEADFRRPVQGRLLDVSGTRGLADVLQGALDIDGAMQMVELAAQTASAEATGPAQGGATAVLESSSTGSVSVLLGNADLDNPPALLARRAMSDLLRNVSEDFDYVLIDAPPPLEVSDAIPLLPVVDGIVIVASVGHTRDISAQRLMHLLSSTSSAPVLGVVANSVSRKDLERYGFAAVPYERSRPHKLIRR